MKILFFNYEFPPLGGGAANATEQLFRRFENFTDIEVDLITSAVGEERIVEKRGKNITIHRIPIGKNPENLNYQSEKEILTYSWRALKYAKELHNDRQYDMTHSFFTVPCGAISLYFKVFFKLPYIVSLRGADVPGYSERFTFLYHFMTPLIRLIWRQAVHVVTNSHGLTELAKASAKDQKFEEIFNGIDIEKFTPSLRGTQQKEEDFVILCAARLTYRKGFHNAIDGFAQICEKYPHIRMIIAGGDGGVMQKLKGQAQALGVLDRIAFPGYYTKQMAPEMYAQSDVFLMPSYNEGMSNNVLEALASGLPLLMTSTGGSDELIEDGKNGFLIKFHSGQDIADKLEILLSDLEKTREMGRRSREIVQELSWQKAADQYHLLYKNL